MDSAYECPPKMAAPCSPDAEPRAAISSPSATREPFGTPTSFLFPKTARILRTADFRKTYNEGKRFTARCFAAFCLRVQREPDQGPRVGFTVPRAFGKAVLRNRVKRRIREALRMRLPEVAPEWDIVINPRRPAIAAPVEELRREVDRLVAQKAVIATLRFYKRFLSPVLPSACRFSPTCSEYMMEAVEKYGAVRGVGRGLLRLLRCHPLHAGGFDPVR
jgi:putative membrane protein insertion efficiency factor/ribonuclease P protein component